MFGGAQGATTRLLDMWAWDGTGRVELTPASAAYSPPKRRAFGMMYASARDRIVLNGGVDDASELTDTWEFDGTLWSRRMSISVPPGRRDYALSYDTSRSVSVLFGGTECEVLSSHQRMHARRGSW